jgi:hypothetical protein
MSKAEITITQSYQVVATGAAIISVKKQGAGALFFNETASDVAAYQVAAAPGEQFEQTAVVDTHVRASGDGWVIIADGVL